MMALNHLRKITPLLEYLVGMDKSDRVKFLKQAGTSIIKVICDIIFNVNRGNLDLSPTVVDSLRQYKTQIKSLCVLKKSIETRRKELLRKDFVGKVLPHLVPSLLEYLVPKSGSK